MESSLKALTDFERIGFIGGTFDPLHIGHLIVAEEAREQLKLPSILFIPGARPPHKRQEAVREFEHRYNMVQLATAQHSQFHASRLEMQRQGPSYTITTIRQLRQQTDAEIYFITGSDAVLDMPNWYRPESIIAEATVVTVPRPGFDTDDIPAAIGPQQAKNIRVLDGPAIDISSTVIRKRIAAGRSIRYLVPQAVRRYIDRHRLYASAEN